MTTRLPLKFTTLEKFWSVLIEVIKSCFFVADLRLLRSRHQLLLVIAYLALAAVTRAQAQAAR